MKKTAPMLLLLFLAIFGFGPIQALASHFLGATITYQHLGPNSYLVSYTGFRDCNGATMANTVNLNLQTTGCTSGRSVTLTKSANSRFGDPYCPAVGNGCTGPGRRNHEEVEYTGVVTFSAAEQACTDWLLSVTQPSRAPTMNLISNSNDDVYTEAYLNLAVGNNGAVFNQVAPARPLVCVGEEIMLNFAVSDADCDSVSYELAQPLKASGTPVPYAPIGGNPGGTIVVNPNPLPPYNTSTNPQFAILQGLGNAYSVAYPIPSFSAPWNVPDPATGIPPKIVTAAPYFKLDPVTGVLNFKPAAYNPIVAANISYAVSVQVIEWRKISGVVTKVGHVRREMLFQVEDCAGNKLPTFTSLMVNGKALSSGEVITIRPGAQLNLQFATADQATDVLTVESDVSSVLSGATFSTSSATHPIGAISWTAAGPTCQIKWFYLTVKDDFCPISGKQTYLIGVRVGNIGTALGNQEELSAAGKFLAYPNPFTSELQFRLDLKAKAENIIIYNLLGQQVDQIPLKHAGIGEQNINWENAGKHAAGTYLARLVSGGKTIQAIKFMKVK
ncbi:T9SS type A sorting domain-containing protein [Adhaeribacter soli]|uniref:T9SS type A sorting domain-containing protein n=1 Tax=Adhaeribacter soli TaxID=2607655 RepID=A0A5N1J1E3_9BACT|nr:T9SS type A sorting domain-containing protein [Adhaeribacter soli]KAA9340568.1 T9SS type A sorting domain-containing protein [Adhaeribacter soli]